MEKKTKISLIINIIIFILTVIATVCMMAGIHFMGAETNSLTARNITVFRFFTVESNILMGIMALVFSIFEIKVLTKKRDHIPSKLYILKLISTVGVVLTMLTTVLFLAPTSKHGYFSLFTNSNLFFHFVIPLLSLITFIFFEKTEKIKFKYTFAGIIPMFLYGIFYSINIFTHIENGKVSPIYDWYGFVQNGIKDVFFVIPVILGATYLISFLLWDFNKKRKLAIIIRKEISICIFEVDG